MPATPIRGSWLLQDGLRRRWVEAALDDAFREAWPDKTRKDVLPFNDTEARAAEPHPRPYCVVEYQEPIPIGNSAGKTADTEIRYEDHKVIFRIYGNTKSQAREFAGKVADAFVKKRLTIAPDRHIETLIDPDFPVREGDKTWFWCLQYRVRVEGDYPLEYT